MKKRRLFATVVLVLMMVLAQVFTVMAETEVRKIRINVTNYNGQLKFTSGEEEKYTVTWPTETLETVVGYEEVEVEVQLETKEGYVFKDIRRGDISFKNDKSGVKCTDVSENEHQVRVYVTINYARGKLDAPTSAWWDSDDFGKACWDEVSNADGYKVTINGNEIVDSSKMWEDDDVIYIDLRPYLQNKNNTFKVKATSSKNGVKDSDYVKSDDFDPRDWDEDDDSWNYNWNDNWNNSWNPSQPSYNPGGWISYNGAWYYINNKGEITKGWLDLGGKKYYLNDEGIMLTGWQKINGAWYCFASDGNMLRNTVLKSANGQFDYYLDGEGHMQTNRWQRNSIGWYYVGDDEPIKNCERNIDGKDYRFNNDGYMMTGWWSPDGWSYYYYSPDGSKAKNTILWIDNRYYRFDENGKWIA